MRAKELRIQNKTVLLYNKHEEHRNIGLKLNFLFTDVLIIPTEGNCHSDKLIDYKFWIQGALPNTTPNMF